MVVIKEVFFGSASKCSAWWLCGFPVPLQKRLTASVDKKMFVVGLTKGVKAARLLFFEVHFSQDGEAQLLDQQAGFGWKKRSRRSREKPAEADFAHFHAVSCSCLTNEVPYPQRPLGRRRVAAQEVHGNAGQSDADADQRVDGVTVERHDHQEDAQEAEHDGVHEAELEGGEEHMKLQLGSRFGCI